VLLNLVRNAAQAYRQSDSSRNKAVEISVHKHEGAIAIDIADTAGGISEDKRPWLFDPPSLMHAKGLGLYLSQRIMKNSGGGLTYIPVDGGSVFRIHLPFVPV
jgi:C4-dicarboxylate-specific signal transduction histidine kinase